MVANEKGINYIIDDGLLISGNEVLAGISAKKAPTKIETVRNALFQNEERKKEIQAVIKKKKPDSILILGTSDEMVRRIADEIQKQIYELGDDGRLVNMQLEELMGGVEKEENLIIKDYLVPSRKKRKTENVMQELTELQHEEMNKETTIAKLLGYDTFDNYDEVGVYTRGYRILNKIPRMPSNIVENLVASFKSFQHILDADIESLDDVEGIGEVRARTIKQSLRRMQEQFMFE